MANDETMMRREPRKNRWPEIMPASTFGFPSMFGIRISRLCSRSAHLRDFRQTQHPTENFFSRRVFHLIDTDRVGYIEAARSRPAQRFQMGAGTKRFADVVNIRADIEAFAAQHAKIDFG